MEKSLTLLYTAQLGGDLALLPRLYTFLKMLRAEFSVQQEDDPAGRPYKDVLLCDLGGACADTVWHCAATEGRSTLIVLDAMGYSVANVEGTLNAANREKLTQQVNLQLVDDAHPHRHNDVLFFAGTAQPAANPGLAVSLSPAESVLRADAVLRLGAVDAGQVGVVRLKYTPDTDWTMLYSGVHDLPTGTAQDATIAGTVDFVEDEAHYLLKRRGGT